MVHTTDEAVHTTLEALRSGHIFPQRRMELMTETANFHGYVVCMVTYLDNRHKRRNGKLVIRILAQDTSDVSYRLHCIAEKATPGFLARILDHGQYTCVPSGSIKFGHVKAHLSLVEVPEEIDALHWLRSHNESAGTIHDTRIFPFLKNLYGCAMKLMVEQHVIGNQDIRYTHVRNNFPLLAEFDRGAMILRPHASPDEEHLFIHTALTQLLALADIIREALEYRFCNYQRRGMVWPAKSDLDSQLLFPSIRSHHDTLYTHAELPAVVDFRKLAFDKLLDLLEKQLTCKIDPVRNATWDQASAQSYNWLSGLLRFH